ncbi:MAG TPA: N-acetylglucosamine-6-phosphate deacetylase [Sphaerochaeta sp.]|nr:N-acetylglucosamine-6-phosphate deacetylase [Sphaerochaeta sp.]
MNESLLIRGGKVYRNGRCEELDLFIEDGAFTGFHQNRPAGGVFEAENMHVIPGMIDIHTHGAVGVDFNLFADEQEIEKVVGFFASKGVSGFLPTVLTDEPEVMKTQLSKLARPALLKRFPQILGIHLEGPFLNASYKGAMKEELLKECDLSCFDELQDAARGMIRVITLSPEVRGCRTLIRELTGRGVRVSLGHSGAGYEETIGAIDAGASSTTHIMNAMKLLHMHDPAILTAVLERDIYAEMIVDGFHLHPPIVRLLLKIKGWDRMISVTDSIMAAGYPDGEYLLGPNRVIVKDGDAKLVENGVRAGSTLTMDKALRNLLDFTRAPLQRIVPLLSTNAARMLGLSDLGEIALGKRADATILDSSMDVVATITSGKIAYRREE